MRILGLDVGDKTIGVAISDPLGWTAQGVKTIKRVGIKKDLQEILSIIKQHNVEKIVVGLPKNMNGTLGPQSEKVLNFCEKLKEVCNLEIILEDERLTTVAAERMLMEADMHWSKRKKSHRYDSSNIYFTRLP
ncbi:putative pre-16S rRNA nuclease [Thermobrachium celere]|nr:putative pre-16S rRNA nuclease [Thermobrachium celere]